MEADYKTNEYFETGEDQGPAYSGILHERENNRINTNDFLEQFKDQYINLNIKDNPINLIRDYGIEDYEIFKDFLEYINNNYIQITNIEQITNDELRTIQFTNYIYEFMFFDLFVRYIPNFMDKYKIEDVETIVNIDYQDIGNKLRTVIADYLSILDSSKNTIVDDEVGRVRHDVLKNHEILKLTTAIELLSDDLEDFCENFLFQLIFQLNMGDNFAISPGE